MRYAIFSDIHGNRQAWDAVLADMEDLEVQVYVCLGDVVGYGPCPQEVLSEIRARTENILVGNHDAAAAGLMDSSVFNPVAREAIDWTREQLDEESLSFLARMPLAIESEELLFVHAEVVEPGRFGYIETAAEVRENFAARDHRVTFVGHTHRPALFCQEVDGSILKLEDQDCMLNEDLRYIVNVGSVGEPRTYEDIRARYVIYDSDSRKLYYRRIEFDPESYRIDLLGSGLAITPFFLTVFDRRLEEHAAMRAISEGSAAVMETDGAYDEGVRELVVPTGIAGDTSSASMPIPQPTPAPTHRRSRSKSALLVIPLLAALVGGVFYLANNERDEEEEPAKPAALIDPWAREADNRGAIALVGPPIEAMAPAPGEIEFVGPAAPDTEPLPAIAVVPVLPPVTPNPVPAVVPAPPDVLQKMIGLGEGLLFYTSLDEAPGTTVLRDLSDGGRDLQTGAAILGEAGQVGLACRFEKGGALTSVPKVLPSELKGLTISFWLRLPPKVTPKKPKEAGVDPPSNLVSFHEYCELRIENKQIVANLDRMGEVVRVDYPQDAAWHHVLVENGGGITTIWIDNSTNSDPRAEDLPKVPPGVVAVTIGSPEANFTIDEVAVWSRRFSRDERVILYRRGKNGTPILTPERTIAHWSFDEEAGSRLFGDSEGNNFLGSYKSWTPVVGIAPNPVPLTLKANAFAAQILHVGEAPEKAGTFRMRSEAAFTYEGWVKFNGVGGTLGGTISDGDEDGAHGWRIAARRGRSANGFLAFMYETGAEKVQALAKELPLFDGFAHHFAAVWNPADSATHGKMTLYLDNEVVASASLALADLRPDASGPFRIQGQRVPLILDELRFSSAALQPTLFLTAGLGARVADDPFLKGESVLERRDREIRERKQLQLEARKREDAERIKAAKVKKKKEDDRKAEEEAKRNRKKLGL
ncbi:MAG: metallophosphoesterase family protein [Roseibacillus sp.]